jgi:hypothetical protein
MHLPRDRIRDDLDEIGYTWTDRLKKGWLLCGAHVPTDAFYALCESVARLEYAELIVDVRNLQRGHGTTSQVAFHPDLTDFSDEE